MSRINNDLDIREQFIARLLRKKEGTFNEIKSVVGLCSMQIAEMLRDLEKMEIITSSWKSTVMENGRIRLEKVYKTNKELHHNKWISVLIFRKFWEMTSINVDVNAKQMVLL